MYHGNWKIEADNDMPKKLIGLGFISAWSVVLLSDRGEVCMKLLAG